MKLRRVGESPKTVALQRARCIGSGRTGPRRAKPSRRRQSTRSFELVCLFHQLHAEGLKLLGCPKVRAVAGQTGATVRDVPHVFDQLCSHGYLLLWIAFFDAVPRAAPRSMAMRHSGVSRAFAALCRAQRAARAVGRNLFIAPFMRCADRRASTDACPLIGAIKGLRPTFATFAARETLAAPAPIWLRPDRSRGGPCRSAARNRWRRRPRP